MRLESQKAKERRLRLNAYRAVKAKIREGIRSGELSRLPPGFRGTIRLSCPSSLSLDNNFDETVAFFKEVKELARHIVERRKYRPTSPIHYSIGLERLQYVSVRCAVILAAEIDRLRLIAGDELYYEGAVADDNESVTLLRELGLFRLIGSRHRNEPPDIGLAAHGHRTAIQLMSGLRCDERKFRAFEVATQTIFDAYRTTAFIHCGLAEAMLNVTNHAYISEYPLKYPSSGKRWWAAAVLDTQRSELKVLVFDQGHGIAKTLPASGFMEQIEIGVSKMLGTLTKRVATPDEMLVRAALEFARSRTQKDERGKGFKDIQAPLFEVRESRLRITSGRAEVTLRDGHATVCLPLRSHIGGTLIEWVFPIQSFRQMMMESF